LLSTFLNAVCPQFEVPHEPGGRLLIAVAHPADAVAATASTK